MPHDPSGAAATMPSPPMSSIIDQFCREHFALQAASAQRQAEVKTALDRYQAFLGDKPIEQAGGPELSAFMAELLHQGFAPSSVKQYRARIRPLYTWLSNAERIDANQILQIRSVKPPRAAKHEPRPYSKKEIRQLYADIAARFPLKSDLSIKRWRGGTSSWAKVSKHGQRLQFEAVVALALVCGLRRFEIFQLTLDDIHPDNGQIPVRGKGDKLRTVPYVDAAREPIARWLQFRRWMRPRHDSVWLRMHGPYRQPMTWTQFRPLLSRIGDGYELHRLRHTAATEWLRAGVEIQYLQRFMGHSSIEQTLAYAKIVDLDVETVFEAAAARFRPAA